jgi:hypothetical protein
MEKDKNDKLSQVDADKMLKLPKMIIQGGRLLHEIAFNFYDNLEIKWDLSGKDNVKGNEYSFILKIWRSEKFKLKITLHHQECGYNCCLIRIDFNGVHHNPPYSEKVPKKFEKYADQYIKCSHVHYYVEGYKPGAWAIPISDDKNFSITEINDFNYNSVVDKTLDELSKIINLQTEIKYENPLNFKK